MNLKQVIREFKENGRVIFQSQRPEEENLRVQLLKHVQKKQLSYQQSQINPWLWAIFNPEIYFGDLSVVSKLIETKRKITNAQVLEIIANTELNIVIGDARYLKRHAVAAINKIPDQNILVWNMEIRSDVIKLNLTS